MRETMLVLHFIGLAMGLGTSFAFLFLGMAAQKMAPEKGREFLLNATAVSRMGHIGLALLIISGLYLITPYWSVLGSMPLLIAKLVLVLVVAAVVGISSSYVRKAKQGNAEVYFPKMAMLGRVGLLSTLTIVVLAVLVFR